MRKLSNPFRKPNANEIAVRDLEDAKRALLREQAAAEYHAKMADYYDGIIHRLTNYLKDNA